MSKRKKIIVLLFAGLFLLLFIIYGHLRYRPPFLSGGESNPPGKVYDFFRHAWHYSRGIWLNRAGRGITARREKARAAWYRPARAEKLLTIPPGELYDLGREYAWLGLDERASLLFQKAFSSGPRDRKRALEIISYLAALKDWPAAGGAARSFLEAAPESTEGNYWYGRSLLETGRPGEAGPYLERAWQLDPSLVDSLYQAARAGEKSGEKNQALSRYQEVVTRLPVHLGAWKALRRLYREKGKEAGKEEADLRCNELAPESPREVNVENEFMLLGYDFSSPEIKTGDEATLDLYLKGWRPGPVKGEAEVQLSSISHPGKMSRRGKPFVIPTAGAVVRYSLSWHNSQVLYPGKVSLGVSFFKPGSGERLKATSKDNDDIFITYLSLTPGWMRTAPREKLVKQHFGATARSLGKSTFLGPGSEIVLKLEGQEKTTSLGMISYGHNSTSCSQGDLLARVLVRSREGEELVYPLAVGEQTAEVWWEFALPGKRRHGLAPVFRSWPVSRGEKDFPAHEYYAVFRFPRPLIVESVRIKHVGEKGGLYVADLILIGD